MKITEVSVEIKRVYKYQSYSARLTASIEQDDNYLDVVRKLQTTAKNLVVEKIKKDYKKENES